jgi:hypothetical protein
VGVCIRFYRWYGVNYTQILDIHPRNKMKEPDFYKIFLTLFAGLLFTGIFEVLSIKGYV